MGTLQEDLETYANEFYTRRDLEAGLKLVGQVAAEVGGIVAIGSAVSSLVLVASGVLAPLGITLGAGTIYAVMVRIRYAYPMMSTQERKSLRAVARWINRGFGLFE